ncbi:MAG: hypothetical protein HY509_05550, partial [Acidobacteria bacterium]|nr:hypothetical protein [Acidobacteriota bacterium]
MHVPGWHEATKNLQAAGRVQMVGILQEQHPDRARLFMQWKRMEWPLLWDPLNLLGVPYVPITLAIDEHGVVRGIHPPRDDPGGFETFVETAFAPPDPLPPTASPPDLDRLRAAASGGGAEAKRDLADALFLLGEKLDEVIRLYRDAARLEPRDGAAHFRLGVAYRLRHDSPDRRPGDFQKAIDHWNRALEIDPNDYIRRRRIQQYGPRQDKPYPFYDWMEMAREEIRARGESPLPLALEPEGAETAPPAGALSPTTVPEGEPDPDGRIHRDRRPFIRTETTVVPETRPEGLAARIHVEFRPNEAISAHWNNEAEDLVLWVAPPPGWTVERRL